MHKVPPESLITSRFCSARYTELNFTGIDFVPTLHHGTYPAVDPLKADLSGKIVLISGASRGIGRAIAVSYAKAGASGVVICARSDLSSVEQELLDAAKQSGRPEPKVLRLTIDTTDRTQVEEAASKVSSVFGHVDILINNAGYAEDVCSIVDSDPDEWWKVWEVNVKGVYLMSRFFVPLVLKSPSLKTVVMVSSMAAHLILPGMSGYQSTKSSVLRLNDFLMAECGDAGLLAYGIHPGAVNTDMAKKMPKYILETLIDTPELAGDSLVWLTKERREW